MVEIEIDGKVLSVEKGSSVLEAAHAAGTYIPHFCYHKKLSIAANCRMCLVEVEKVPKPLPACATPVAEGMKIFTHSELAVKAQKGVMEFLLINHPLDCPICDQGGECQLQDLAVGYGSSASRYTEDKRAVTNKDLGPLITTDMTRCIHCSRCVRFTEEIAGLQELGMPGRGEHTEVMPFIAKTVNSEISGNVIDICPVGALTSKPFRYTARNWELSRRKSISPHDGLGSHLEIHVKNQQVMRVLPRENEAINECWLADRDRFSYEGLNSEQRLTVPMIKYDGKWHEVDWTTALEYVVKSLHQITAEHQNTNVISAIAAPNSTLEELFLLKKLMHHFGNIPVETRLRQSDFALDEYKEGVDWLGQTILELLQNDAVLVVGSNLRKEQPLLAQRLRQSVKKGMTMSVVGVAKDEQNIPLTGELIARADQLVEGLGEVLLAVLEKRGQTLSTHIRLEGVKISEPARVIAQNLLDKKQASILLGNIAITYPRAAEIRSIIQEIARLTGAKVGVMSMAANSVGAEILGLHGGEVWSKKSRAYLSLHLDPVLDGHNAALVREALQSAHSVIALSSYQTENLLQYADVLLPIAPFSETSGTFINMEGTAQSFHGVVRPLGETRPAWKVLRVLGNMLQFNGFDYNSSEEIRDEVLSDSYELRLSTKIAAFPVEAKPISKDLVRLGEIPLYQLDMLSRQAPSLQKTQDALWAEQIYVNSALMADKGLVEGDIVRVRQAEGEALLPVAVDHELPDHVVRVPATMMTSQLAGLFDPIFLEKA